MRQKPLFSGHHANCAGAWLPTTLKPLTVFLQDRNSISGGCDYFSRVAPFVCIRKRQSGAFPLECWISFHYLEILASLLAWGDSRYTSAKARDRYPFPPFIQNPCYSLSTRRWLARLPVTRKLLPILTTAFPTITRILRVFLDSLEFFFSSLFFPISNHGICDTVAWLKIYNCFLISFKEFSGDLQSLQLNYIKV